MDFCLDIQNVIDPTNYLLPSDCLHARNLQGFSHSQHITGRNGRNVVLTSGAYN